MTFAEFIRAHETDDPVRLLLSRDKFPDIDLDLAVTTLEVRRRLRTKVPEWYAVPSLLYPSRLSGEQCSSSDTARYKALVAESLFSESLFSELLVSGGGGIPKPSLRDPSQNGFWAPPSYAPEGGHRFGDPTAPGNPDDINASCHSGQSTSCHSERSSFCHSERSPFCHSERSEGISRIADLTGGMGVDAWAFAQVAGEVLYNEMQTELAKATELNFKELGVGNMRFRNEVVEPGKVKEVLDGFEPDVIYLDPARRAEDGKKVFLIEDCRPDVLGLLPELFAASRFVLLKLSPMADITMACKRLGHVREVHVVASGGECKELLFVLERAWEGDYTVFVVEGGSVMEIPGQAGNDGEKQPENDGNGKVGKDGSASLVISTGAKRNGEIYLFEPGKALAKAGAFNLPCTRFGLTKLATHTHLYVGETMPEGLAPFGKWFEIIDLLPLNNRNLKEVGKRYPQAEVTARNIPMTSDLLRKKTGCASGGDVHLFGIRADAVADPGNYLIICKRIGYGKD